MVVLANTRAERQGAAIALTEVTAEWMLDGRRVVCFEDISWSVDAGECVALTGPSGVGKSTLLGVIGGWVRPTRGAVLVGERQVRGPGPDCGIVFQDGALFPWLTLAENVAFGLKSKAASKKEKLVVAARWIERLGLSGFGSARPHELSGGMRRRGAIARALAADPGLLLLDEPLTGLDATTQRDVVDVLEDWSKTGRRTLVIATHQLDVVQRMGLRTCVLEGRPARLIEAGDLLRVESAVRLADVHGAKRRGDLPLGLVVPEDVSRAV